VIESQYHEAGARRSEDKEERIRVGSDEYTRNLVRDGPERLEFRGERYRRWHDGDWEKISLITLASMTIKVSSYAEATDVARPLNGSLFVVHDVANVKRLSDQEIGGRASIGFEDPRDLEISPTDPDVTGYSGKITQWLWFSADDLLLHRCERTIENYYRGQLTGRTRQISEFFDLNSAQLPGPLPAS